MDRRLYLKHFMIILTGNGAAQAVNLLSYPLLARLYTPHEFGGFATFVAASAIPGALACARFELAIPTASKAGRPSVLWLCLCLALAAGVLSMAGAQLYWQWRYTVLAQPLPLLFGLTVSLTGVTAALSMYLLRHEQYRLTSTAVFGRTASAVVIQIGLALLAPTAQSLIIGFVGGLAIQTVILGFSLWRHQNPGRARLRHMRAMMSRFRRQVSLDLPSTLLSSLNVNLLTILLGWLYGQRAVGFYSIGNRLAAVPLQMINDALSQTFFQKAAKAKEDKGHFWEEMKFSVKTSGLFSVAALVGMLLFARPLIILYLGPTWAPSATMLIILAPMIAAMSVAQSSATAVFVLRKTHWRLLHTSGLVALHCVLFALARHFQWTIFTYLGTVSASFTIVWLVYGALLMNASRRSFRAVSQEV